MKIERGIVDRTQIGEQLGGVDGQLESDLINVVVDADGCEPEPH